jgi:hypothetical protein
MVNWNESLSDIDQGKGPCKLIRRKNGLVKGCTKQKSVLVPPGSKYWECLTALSIANQQSDGATLNGTVSDTYKLWNTFECPMKCGSFKPSCWISAWCLVQPPFEVETFSKTNIPCQALLIINYLGRTGLFMYALWGGRLTVRDECWWRELRTGTNVKRGSIHPSRFQYSMLIWDSGNQRWFFCPQRH